MSSYRGVNHMAFATSDLDMTIRFWRDLLGMRLVLTSGRSGYKVYFFEVSRGSLVGFFEWPGVQPAPEKEHGRPESGPFAFDHVSIGVEDEDALYALKDTLNAADIWVSEVTDHGFIHSIYTFDPNGIPLEFSVLVAGVDLSAHPVFADLEPPEAAQEGPEPQEGRWLSSGIKENTKAEDRRVYPGMGSELFKGDRQG